ncbi:uncharacterized protein LOC135143662 isoform X1 [Zophobas morio]|uniref:uncharacterized protein LOC135143662 isoform X1 n=1 Tax=Zophobas morio TaxID=2755281 RepID=UPI003083AE36
MSNNEDKTLTYESLCDLSYIDWSKKAGSLNLAACTYLLNEFNKIEILSLKSHEDKNLVHNYSLLTNLPCTAIRWCPSPLNATLLCCSSDKIRIWQTKDLENPESSSHLQYSAVILPVRNDTLFTALDWNYFDPGLIAACGINAQVTVWNASSCQVFSQVLAHDGEIYDIKFGSESIFSTCGDDGTLRAFDLRCLEHSSIIYESETPLLRLSWNNSNSNYIATFGLDDLSVTVVDLRVPAIPVYKLAGHFLQVSAIEWSPGRANHLWSTGYDKQSLLWNLNENSAGANQAPIVKMTEESAIHDVKWTSYEIDNSNEWIIMALGNQVKATKVQTLLTEL